MLQAVSPDPADYATPAPESARLFRGIGECRRKTLLKSQFSPLFAPVMCGAAGYTSDGCRFGFNL
ncbi:hypothetical protein A8E95_18155 [Burkholderia cenocepacia]|nr:hypothetical protein A8E88_18195 [Burkholderia cenocepacia]AQQ36832.1 hypothetical protein A8E96_33210 [Burkholderia cenocepacia]ONV99133.1 hypothetical protein A8E89_03100 [Burkholderia cenocepacia]ONW10979.1 hypothetical protein A8E94_21405 [Burkholderia cenocepacia]ONW31701.1 hypothetical protein A8E95_18155 [Burkholderia cenocepacia]